jgi:long-chain-fatty-acid---luciferin-component ligase
MMAISTNPQEASAVSRVRANNYDALDQVLFEGRDVYRGLGESRFDWIVTAVRHHMAYSKVYRRLADACDFTIDTLIDSRDLTRVPLVSSGSFKRALFDAGPGVRRCTSSGTMGSKSIVPRDSRTLERFVGSIASGLSEFIGHNELQHAYILGPPSDEAGDLWFSYSLGLAELFNDADYYVHRDTFDPERLVEALKGRAHDEEPVIAAPPTLILALLDWLDDAGIKSLHLGESMGWVITAGGWKTAAKGAIDRAGFDARVAEAFGIERDHIRDVFNMVELNTIIFECEQGVKHIPPWLSVTARNPRDLSIMPSGGSGLLAYIDPTPLSYPGFILSDDIGSVIDAPCACGRSGDTLELERRLEVVEERGCGLKMERYATGGVK